VHAVSFYCRCGWHEHYPSEAYPSYSNVITTEANWLRHGNRQFDADALLIGFIAWALNPLVGNVRSSISLKDMKSRRHYYVIWLTRCGERVRVGIPIYRPQKMIALTLTD